MRPSQDVFKANAARIIRSARKLRGHSQSDLAKKLDISQSKLSKIESGLLEPTVSQWLSFCDVVGVSSDDGKHGYIDCETSAELISGLHVGLFKLPERYSRLRASKVRVSQPLLKYFANQMGEEKLAQFVISRGLDPDYLAILDNQLNADFNLDIVRELISSGNLNKENISNLASYFSFPEMHGSVGIKYLAADGLFSLVELLKQNLEKYEVNCTYNFLESKGFYIDLEVVPLKHFDEFDYLDNTLGDFVGIYKQLVFKVLFTQFGKLGPCQIKVLQKQQRKGEKAVYRFSM